MRTTRRAEYPPDVERCRRRAVRLEWVTLAYVSSAALLLYVTMGSSQAMRASFFEDLLSLVPSAAFLVSARVARRAPTDRFPYGQHRATALAHVVAALALTGFGGFLLVESLVKLFGGHRATIGGIRLFGTVVWAGWPMLAALVYTSIPSVILGRIKGRLASPLHDKVLHADADMMRADWLAEAATAVGVIGAGFGVWWLDPLAASVVAGDILKDGVKNLRSGASDLMNRRPRKADDSDWEPFPERILALVRELDWVEDASVRLREDGHLFFGDVLVVPRPGTPDLVRRLGEAHRQVLELDWRVHDVVIAPVERLPRGGE